MTIRTGPEGGVAPIRSSKGDSGGPYTKIKDEPLDTFQGGIHLKVDEAPNPSHNVSMEYAAEHPSPDVDSKDFGT